MNILALLLSMIAGALAAAVVCKAIKLRLFIDIGAFCGCLGAFWLADKLAADAAWVVSGLISGFVFVVIYLRQRSSRQVCPDKQ